LRGRRKTASAIIVDAIGSRVDRIVAVPGPRLRIDAGSVKRSAASVGLLAVAIETVLQIDGHHLANGHEAEQSIIGHLRLTDWTTEARMQRLPPTDSTTAALTTHVASIRESRAPVDCLVDADGTERSSSESTFAIEEIVAGRNASPGLFYRTFRVVQGERFLSIWDILPESWHVHLGGS
jgi:hypothetical protein